MPLLASPIPSLAHARPRWLAYLLSVPFAGCLFGAWAWFSLAPTDYENRFWLLAQTNLTGYVFIEESVSESVKRTLATTNVLSGTFSKMRVGIRDEREDQTLQVSVQSSGSTAKDAPTTSSPDADRVTVFFASWSDDSHTTMPFVRHSPDFCWTFSGGVFIDIGQPRRMQIEISEKGEQGTASLKSDERAGSSEKPQGFPLLFECAAYKWPHSKSNELVVWTTVVEGKTLAGIDGSSAAPAGSDDIYRASRRVFERFWSAATRRLPVRGNKQFIRYSVPCRDWETGAEILRAFGRRWLTLSQGGGSNDTSGATPRAVE